MVVHWLKERRELRAGQKESAGHNQAAHSEEQPKVAQPLPGIGQESDEIHRSYFVTDEVTAPGNWKKSIAINVIGAIATFVVLCVFIATKFLHGAWIVVVVIPILVVMFRPVHKHYLMVAKQLSTEGLEPLRTLRHTVIVPISGIHRG
jgi:hypothetical protein